MTSPIKLDPEQCRLRQRRLVEIIRSLNLDRAILIQHAHIQYFTGFRPHKLMAAVVSLDADGKCLLVAPNSAPDDAAADQVGTFEAQWRATLRQEQLQAAAEVLRQMLDGNPTPKRVGVEFSSFGPHCRQAVGLTDNVESVDLEPPLWQLRRNKDADELAMICRAIQCTDAMYARAKEIIEPGITELEVFNQLHAAAVEVAGEPLTDIGNDYQCNSSGGPPRPRAAQSGELFVLDLGPAYRGYYADNCRTFCVDQPSEEQHEAWQAIVATLDIVEKTVRPGVRCQDLFNRAKEMLDKYRTDSFFHHLGHGFGLFPHEGPHLNPNWDDTFQEGDIFTAEPGLYELELKAGIRLEQNYRVTANGVERLTSFPLDL